MNAMLKKTPGHSKNATCRGCREKFHLLVAAGHQERLCPKCTARRSDAEDEEYFDLMGDELIGAPGTPGSTLSGLRDNDRRRMREVHVPHDARAESEAMERDQ